jgi:hypothetical protein
MITRRKLLAFLGLGGAAAAVASKAEALPAGVTTETLATKPPLLVVTVPRNSTVAERQALADQLRACISEGDVAVIEQGTTVSLQQIADDYQDGERLLEQLRRAHDHRFDMLTNRCSCGARYAEHARSLELQRGMVEADRHAMDAFDALCEFKLRGRKP